MIVKKTFSNILELSNILDVALWVNEACEKNKKSQYLHYKKDEWNVITKYEILMNPIRGFFC